MNQFIPLHSFDYLCKISNKMWLLKKAILEMRSEQLTKDEIRVVCKGSSEYELISWLDSSVG